MSGLVLILVSILGLWMLACAYCGFKKRFVLFLAVLIGGLSLNMFWMVLGLKAHPFEPNALIAQAAVTLYAAAAFGGGWLVGRLVRLWRDSSVKGTDV